MYTNENLKLAKRNKNDEFYTQYCDIEAEIKHYRKCFRGKVIYCNCDNPKHSQFYRYFKNNFNRFGLKKLIVTYHKKGSKVYKIEMYPGVTLKKQMKGDGDFRNEECIELLRKCDIVVTNPPFSLFREYVAQLIKYKKKFLIIGNTNAITYKEFFKLIKGNQVWTGFNEKGGTRKGNTLLFGVLDSYESKSLVIKDGKRYIQVPAWWFTNLNHKKRHKPLDLQDVYCSEKYPKYDNYDAIEVSRTAHIPKDYYGVMGVPITVIAKYCPEQFEIIGMGCGWNGKSELVLKKYSKKQVQYDKDGRVHEVGKLNDGTPLIEIPGKSDIMTCYEADGHYYVRTYHRILIKRK